MKDGPHMGLIMGCKLFVANLPAHVTAGELQKVFAPFGVVKWADVAMDTATLRSKGFGFVQMASEQDAHRATRALSGRDFQGKRLVVSKSKKSPAGASPAAAPVPSIASERRPRPRLVAGQRHHRSPRRG